ncbi:hypothetical protein TRVL_04367 [Trypanosoma vivax]|nr:hypothetical protein TRVL_04367 [Trypanosoma vivax]
MNDRKGCIRDEKRSTEAPGRPATCSGTKWVAKERRSRGQQKKEKGMNFGCEGDTLWQDQSPERKAREAGNREQKTNRSGNSTRRHAREYRPSTGKATQDTKGRNMEQQEKQA